MQPPPAPCFGLCVAKSPSDHAETSVQSGTLLEPEADLSDLEVDKTQSLFSAFPRLTWPAKVLKRFFFFLLFLFCFSSDHFL